VRFHAGSKLNNTDSTRLKTTVGRIFFNDAFPEKIPYFNETITKRKLGEIIRLCLEFYNKEETARILDNIKNIGFRYVTKAGYSLGAEDFPRLDKRDEILERGDSQVAEVDDQYNEGLLTQNERHNKIIEIWTAIKDEVESMNKKGLDQNGPVFAMIESGARGSWGQLTQVIGMKGLVASPSGEIIELPVKGNFKDGYGVLEFFISSHGTRKGLSDTALRTANAGYLTRRLVDVAQDVVVLEEDCGDTEGILITRKDSDTMGEKLMDRIFGRFIVDTVKQGRKTIVKSGTLIDAASARAIDQADVEAVRVRSVLQCKLAKGVCQKCYGYDLGYNRLVEIGTAAGIIAAQSIGEPGTQLTMRTFHTGGVAGVDITKGLPRVEELFEARNPKRRAYITDVAGRVEIEEAEGKVTESAQGRKIFEGKRGQKIVRVKFEGIEEEKINIEDTDEVKVKKDEFVQKDAVLLVRGSGEEVRAKYDGVVKLYKKSLKVAFRGSHIKEYIIPLGFKLLVRHGDLVAPGDQITEGHIDLSELFELKGRVAVQQYMLREIQDIYSSQGQRLNDKHIEIIIRQMFSRVYIEDAGDTDLLPGEVIEKAQLGEANTAVKKNKGAPARGHELFLGISKVSLSTQSFLSAASFQETAKVLINAAVTGKVDYLSGLKENVIIGRKIPAGTGFKEM
jgi:DNA-directed RNA polymerase subunit beta'